MYDDQAGMGRATARVDVDGASGLVAARVVPYSLVLADECETLI